jgi:hypothetical protein
MCVSILMTMFYALIMHMHQATTTPDHSGAIALS